MPIFEYRCDDCGTEFEAFVTRERAATCPACSGGKLAKRLSSPGMVGTTGRHEPAPISTGGGCGAGMCGCRSPID
jgi:putative FmdB family regulatory protein